MGLSAANQSDYAESVEHDTYVISRYIGATVDGYEPVMYMCTRFSAARAGDRCWMDASRRVGRVAAPGTRVVK